MTFLEAASELVKVLADQGLDIGVSGFLFRAQTRSRTGFEDKPITSSALRKRIQKRLQDAGLFEGETLHSFCHSAVQHAAIELKYDVKKLMDLGGWKTRTRLSTSMLKKSGSNKPFKGVVLHSMPTYFV